MSPLEAFGKEYPEHTVLSTYCPVKEVLGFALRKHSF